MLVCFLKRTQFIFELFCGALATIFNHCITAGKLQYGLRKFFQLFSFCKHICRYVHNLGALHVFKNRPTNKFFSCHNIYRLLIQHAAKCRIAHNLVKFLSVHNLVKFLIAHLLAGIIEDSPKVVSITAML